MRKTISMAVCITIGSLALYCGQSTMSNVNPDAAVVPDARAQSCCTSQAPVFTKLYEGDISINSSSPEIVVGAYRQVAVYKTSDCVVSGTVIEPWFRLDASAPYGQTGAGSQYGGVYTVTGSSMQLHAPNVSSSCSGGKVHVLVAGMQ